MTQNVVDGMGPLGTEGSFTTAAITTLSTLRENTDGLLTILSAIVADPFYKWNLAAQDVQNENPETKEAANDAEDVDDCSQEGRNQVEAENASVPDDEKNTRAIARIQEKLQGYEDGTSGERQTVDSQVQLLLNAAQDPDNLCKMFVGWLPFL